MPSPQTKPNNSSFPGNSLRWRPLTILKAPLLMLTLESILAAAFIVYFCRSFRISAALIVVHLPLAFAFFGFSILASGLPLYLRRIRESSVLRYLLGLIPGLTFASIGILYAADFASYFWTGNNINYKLVQLFFYDWRHGGELIPLSRSVYVAVGVFVTLVAAIYVSCAGKISRALENLLLPGRPLSLFKNRARASKSGVIIAALLLGYVVTVATLIRRAPYSELLSSDPFLSFVRSTTEVYDPNYPAYAEKVRQEDQRCRSTYPRTDNFEHKNVVLIIVDALRADHTQVYGYHRTTTPFLAQLAQTGHLHRVEFATSTCSGTFCGVMSTLASRAMKQ